MPTRRTASHPALNPADRRRSPRRPVPGIEGTLRSPGDVRVVDLSLTGLAAELAGEMKPGEHCFLELRHGRSKAMVEAVVKWSALPHIQHEVGRPPLAFLTGMAFVDIDHDGTDPLWEYILPEARA